MNIAENTPPKNLHIKMANSESNDLPNYLKTSGYHSHTNVLFKSHSPQKKYFPEQSYGVSYESPTYFRAKHTLVNKNSYRNPYLTNPEDYDFGKFAQEEMKVSQNSKAESQLFPNKNNKKLSTLQTFRIGENIKGKEAVVFERTKLPALTTYNCILDKKSQIKERELIVQENSSFCQDFNKLNKEPNSFHMTKGLFGDFVERNNIMNVFGHLLKSERNQTFVDRSKEFTNTTTQNSLEKTSKSKKFEKRAFSNGDILKSVSKDSSLDSLSSLLNKKPMDSQISGTNAILIQNGSTTNLSTTKYNHIKKFKLNELKAIPFSLSKYLKKVKEKAAKYQNDTEKFTKKDKKYFNTINNSILKHKIFESLQHKKDQSQPPFSYGTPKVHQLYSEKPIDFEKFEAVSKFYKFLQPLSKRELQKKYKIKDLKNIQPEELKKMEELSSI